MTLEEEMLDAVRKMGQARVTSPEGCVAAIHLLGSARVQLVSGHLSPLGGDAVIALPRPRQRRKR
jgi:hypothetical protein